jgi:head-tail adaptor
MAFGTGPIRKGAGQRDKLVSLQSATTTIDALGGTAQTWATYATEWAAIEPQPFVTGSTNAEVLYLITLPYRAAVVAEQRVVYGSSTYKVLAVIDPALGHRDLTLHCAEVA